MRTRSKEDHSDRIYAVHASRFQRPRHERLLTRNVRAIVSPTTRQTRLKGLQPPADIVMYCDAKFTTLHAYAARATNNGIQTPAQALERHR